MALGVRRRSHSFSRQWHAKRAVQNSRMRRIASPDRGSGVRLLRRPDPHSMPGRQVPRFRQGRSRREEGAQRRAEGPAEADGTEDADPIRINVVQSRQGFPGY